MLLSDLSYVKRRGKNVLFCFCCAENQTQVLYVLGKLSLSYALSLKRLFLTHILRMLLLLAGPRISFSF